MINRNASRYLLIQFDEKDVKAPNEKANELETAQRSHSKLNHKYHSRNDNSRCKLKMIRIWIKLIFTLNIC